MGSDASRDSSLFSWDVKRPAVRSSYLATSKRLYPFDKRATLESGMAPTDVPSRAEKEVVGEEFKAVWLVHGLQSVQLQTAAVVDIHILLLSGCPVLVIVQKLDVPHCLLDLLTATGESITGRLRVAPGSRTADCPSANRTRRDVPCVLRSADADRWASNPDGKVLAQADSGRRLSAHLQ